MRTISFHHLGFDRDTQTHVLSMCSGHQSWAFSHMYKALESFAKIWIKSVFLQCRFGFDSLIRISGDHGCRYMYM